MMIGRLSAAIKPRKGPDRRAVSEAHHVRRDDAERVHIGQNDLGVYGLARDFTTPSWHTQPG